MPESVEPRRGECGECYRENTPLHEDGRCNSCHTLEGDNPYAVEQRGDFLYEVTFDGPLSTYICLKCGANKFIVGSGTYLTALKCVTCGWERCIHGG